VCSGVVLGPKLVATAQRCVRGATRRGVVPLEGAYRVEIASSTLTWTNRVAKHAVLPKCDASELDVAILTLEEPVPPVVQPLRIVSAPGTGARVEALGFGHCVGVARPKERSGVVRSRVSQAFVIDLALCKGDVGGPVVDGRDGDVIGLISHRDDPEGSPLKTTTIARLDTTAVRDLVAQAQRAADGAAPAAAAEPVACR